MIQFDQYTTCQTFHCKGSTLHIPYITISNLTATRISQKPDLSRVSKNTWRFNLNHCVKQVPN